MEYRNAAPAIIVKTRYKGVAYYYYLMVEWELDRMDRWVDKEYWETKGLSQNRSIIPKEHILSGHSEMPPERDHNNRSVCIRFDAIRRSLL